jgi:hypothetical protein
MLWKGFSHHGNNIVITEIIIFLIHYYSPETPISFLWQQYKKCATAEAKTRLLLLWL